jgi:periplasmic protein TonB
MVSTRAALIGFSLAAHVVVGFGIGELDAKKSHGATAIEIAEAKKPAKPPPPPAKVDPPPRKPEPPARERRAAAAKAPAEAPPPPEAPTPNSAVNDLPDFGLALSGGVDGTGVALPSGGSPRGAQAATAKAAPKRLQAVATSSEALDPCQDPPAKPKLRNVPQPAGTEAARAAGIEGKVRVQISVDETGRVVDVKLLQGLGYGLDEAALAAARQAEFDPAVRCGKPTRATFNISMRFTL